MSQRIGAGFTKIPPVICVSLYDVNHSEGKGKGIDLYFDNIEEARDVIGRVWAELNQDWPEQPFYMNSHSDKRSISS